MCTEAGAHPYVESYWPAAHGLGYEHGFVSQVADTVRMLGGRKPEVTMPDFEDAFETCGSSNRDPSACERTPIRMSSVK